MAKLNLRSDQVAMWKTNEERDEEDRKLEVGREPTLIDP
jgi:hypothetical protein